MLKVIICIVAVLGPANGWASGQVPSEHVQESVLSQKAPNFTLAVASGGIKSFYDISRGKKTILLFWATWCPHCHEQLEQLQRDKAVIKEKGIQVVLVDLGESLQEAQGFLKANQMDMDSFVDTDSVLQDVYRLIGVPTLFFIDERGIIRKMKHSLPDDYDTYFLSPAN